MMINQGYYLLLFNKTDDTSLLIRTKQ